MHRHTPTHTHTHLLLISIIIYFSGTKKVVIGYNNYDTIIETTLKFWSKIAIKNNCRATKLIFNTERIISVLTIRDTMENKMETRLHYNLWRTLERFWKMLTIKIGVWCWRHVKLPTPILISKRFNKNQSQVIEVKQICPLLSQHSRKLFQVMNICQTGATTPINTRKRSM